MSAPTSTPALNRRSVVRLGSCGLAGALALQGIRSTAAQQPSSLEANKALARRVFEEAVNGRNGAVIAELYAPAFVDRGTWARQMPGPAGMPRTIDQFHTMFPDVTVTVDVAIAEEDLVATVVTWHGTHPPAGTHVMGRTMHLFRIANELIIEEWSTGWEWLTQRGDRSIPRPRNPLAGT
jgi:predicted SnoaL-like aldol condensation-catalyzing enzyme